MRKRLKDNEGRFRLWIPKQKRWIREALSHIVSMRESQEGTPSSISMEALRILERALEPFMGRKSKKIIHLEFREKDEWLYDEVLKLVKGKKEMGMDVSINFETARLIKAGLMSLQEKKL